MEAIEYAEYALRQALDAVDYAAKPEQGLASLAPKYLDASAGVLELAAQAFRSRALELRRATDGGISPLPENGASDAEQACNWDHIGSPDFDGCNGCPNWRICSPVPPDYPDKEGRRQLRRLIHRKDVMKYSMFAILLLQSAAVTVLGFWIVFEQEASPIDRSFGCVLLMAAGLGISLLLDEVESFRPNRRFSSDDAGRPSTPIG
jgi:hypothetical protein